MKRIRPAPRSPGPRAGREWGLGAQTRRPRPHPDQGRRGPQSPGAPGSLGRTGGPSLGPALDGAPRPSPEGLPRHLRDKVSSTSSSSGPARGAPSLPRLPLFFKIIAPKSPPGGARQTPPPRRAPQEPPPPAARRLSGSRRPRSGPPKGLGARVEVGAIRARGSLPGPAVPAANRAWSDGRSHRGKNTGLVRPHPLCPAPRPAPCDLGTRAEGGELPAAGGWAAPPGLRGARCCSGPGEGRTGAQGAEGRPCPRAPSSPRSRR